MNFVVEPEDMNFFTKVCVFHKSGCGHQHCENIAPPHHHGSVQYVSSNSAVTVGYNNYNYTNS